MSATVAITEVEWQAQVVQLAGLCGWEHMHVRRSIGRRSGGRTWTTTTSVKGWPDLTLWHPTHGLGCVELKTDTGRLTPDQEAVHASLRAAGVPVDVWRPADLDRVQLVLRHGWPTQEVADRG